ncbi:MAG TPA: carbon-nitrogen hydrolase family protein [Actinomycetota bacterium]
MATTTVALLQLAACPDQASNLAVGEAACRRARQWGADIALFPELWQLGYTFPLAGPAGPGEPLAAQASMDLLRAPGRWHDGDDPLTPEVRAAVGAFHERAIGRDDDFVVRFQTLAAELDMAIALTYLERWPGAPRNSVSLIDRHGRIAFTYAKVHTCDFDLPEGALTPGEDFHVAALDTAAGEVVVGAMICYDREFPESARVLMLKGVELILVPNACRLDQVRINQFQSRAVENMVAVALVNYAEPQYNGHSVAFSPVVCDPSGASLDPLVVEAGAAAGVHLATFDLDAIRTFRERECWGNAFRRPHRYGLLTAPEVQPPFVRVDARGRRYDPTSR